MKRKTLFKLVPIIAMCLFAYNFTFLSVRGCSMEPTYRNGDFLIARRIRDISMLPTDNPACWIIDEDGGNCIKRLVGYPGDKVELISGDTYVNGNLVINRIEGYENEAYYKFILHSDEYLFLGDNRADPYDARYWHTPTLPFANIKGVVIGGGLI